MTFPAALAAIGTRISFLTFAWLTVAGPMSLREVVIVATAQLAGYAVFRQIAERVTPVAVGADLLSMVTLGAAAFFTGNLVVLASLAGLLGAQRGLADRSTGDVPAESINDAVRREGLARLGCVLLGLAAGAAVMWLGPLGLLWANAMVFAVCAALRVLRGKGAVTSGEQLVTENIFDLKSDPLVRRLALTLFATNLFAQVAAVLLVVLWVAEVTRSPELLGLAGTAFGFGLLGAALVGSGLVRTSARPILIGLGLFAGGGMVFLFDGRPAVLLLVVVAAMVTGVATASVIPVAATMLSSHVPAALRSQVEGLLSTVSYLSIPVGTGLAAWLLGLSLPLFAGLAVAAGALLIALLIPVLAFRTWRQLMPQAQPTADSTAKLPARLTVTLAYANGQWVVEVRRGRALLGSRHLVRSAEALNMLSILDVPGVHDSVERALAIDQTEAARQADRMRAELSELESKLAGLSEMVEITEAHKPLPPQHHDEATVLEPKPSADIKPSAEVRPSVEVKPSADLKPSAEVKATVEAKSG